MTLFYRTTGNVQVRASIVTTGIVCGSGALGLGRLIRNSPEVNFAARRFAGTPQSLTPIDLLTNNRVKPSRKQLFSGTGPVNSVAEKITQSLRAKLKNGSGGPATGAPTSG